MAVADVLVKYDVPPQVTCWDGVHPELSVSDPNPPDGVNGYNVYRSSDASVPHEGWPRVASNVADAAPARAGVQWKDDSGDVSPTRVWYYDVVAFNAVCSTEGPC